MKKVKRKGFFIGFKRNVDESFNYISKGRRYIYFSISLFILSGLFGFFFNSHLSFINQFLKDILSQTSGLSYFPLIIKIFTNNAYVSLLSIILGFILGIVPLLNALTNGVVLGYVLAKVYAISGFTEFWKILPHGIFELPAVFISLGLGLKTGMALFSKKPVNEIKYRLIQSIKVFLFVVVPLLILAAIIEGTLIHFLE